VVESVVIAPVWLEAVQSMISAVFVVAMERVVSIVPVFRLARVGSTNLATVVAMRWLQCRVLLD
jgi:hypothetical protein